MSGPIRTTLAAAIVTGRAGRAIAERAPAELEPFEDVVSAEEFRYRSVISMATVSPISRPRKTC
jgi:hypothetical protein